MQDLQGKVAVITGAADGIGRAVAMLAVEAGMKVVLADIDADALERAIEAAGAGAEVLGVVVDVANVESVRELERRAVERFGAVNLLVNNAGIAAAQTAWEASLDEWSRVIGVNLMGVVHGLSVFLPGIIASGAPGHVVNVASAAGLVSAPGLASYCATKSAVVALSESLYHDLKLRKVPVGVSVVCPSWVKTRIASRPPPSDVAEADGILKGIRSAIVGAVHGGMPVDVAAAAILEAVRADRFYVLTHDSTKAGVAVRAKDIVEGRPPTLFPLEGKGQER